MHTVSQIVRDAVVTLTLVGTTACGSGGLGNVLGSVLGSQGSGNQVTGVVQGVDTRSNQVVVRLANGQTAYLTYDNQTRVVYNDQYYPITSLERGDEVTARVQSSNNAYYTDLIQVDRSVSTTGGTTRDVVAIQGTVQDIDRTSGWFLVRASNGGTVTISMPYNVTRADDDRFRNLRIGDQVRVYAVPITNTRAEFRQFY